MGDRERHGTFHDVHRRRLQLPVVPCPLLRRSLGRFGRRMSTMALVLPVSLPSRQPLGSSSGRGRRLGSREWVRRFWKLGLTVAPPTTCSDVSTRRSVVMGHDGPVNDFLVVYLDSIDERLLEYLDEDDELKLDAVLRLSFYTTALLDGSITPEHNEEA